MATKTEPCSVHRLLACELIERIQSSGCVEAAECGKEHAPNLTAALIERSGWIRALVVKFMPEWDWQAKGLKEISKNHTVPHPLYRLIQYALVKSYSGVATEGGGYVQKKDKVKVGPVRVLDLSLFSPWKKGTPSFTGIKWVGDPPTFIFVEPTDAEKQWAEEMWNQFYKTQPDAKRQRLDDKNHSTGSSDAIQPDKNKPSGKSSGKSSGKLSGKPKGKKQKTESVDVSSDEEEPMTTWRPSHKAETWNRSDFSEYFNLGGTDPPPTLLRIEHAYTHWLGGGRHIESVFEHPVTKQEIKLTTSETFLYWNASYHASIEEYCRKEEKAKNGSS